MVYILKFAFNFLTFAFLITYFNHEEKMYWVITMKEKNQFNMVLLKSSRIIDAYITYLCF